MFLAFSPFRASNAPRRPKSHEHPKRPRDTPKTTPKIAGSHHIRPRGCFRETFGLRPPPSSLKKKRDFQEFLFFQTRPVSTLPRQSTHKAPVPTEERCHEAFDGHTSAEAKRKLMCFFVPLVPFLCDCDACAGHPSRSLHARNLND